MFARIQSCVYTGIVTSSVTVECDLGRGLAVFTVVGLASSAVTEARIRARSALVNSGYDFPMRRVTVNLAPAHLRKDGCHLDLPIALAILTSDKQMPSSEFDHTLVLGELGLDGAIRPVRGVLPMALHASKAGFKTLLVPKGNMHEAAAAPGLEVLGAEHLTEVVEWAHGRGELPIGRPSETPTRQRLASVDMSDIIGQSEARRALEIAAAGGHNLLLSGPPGCGKSMLAKRMPTIVPPMTFEERLESSTIASVAGLLDPREGLMTERPFRAPHQTASHVALAGGGAMASPGEVSLAHNGILFLDEFPEFPRKSLESLRQPLEDGHICISRAGHRAVYPARFIFVAAMNPCPCGYIDHPRRACDCHPEAVRRYRRRISGPILDRIDIHLRIQPLLIYPSKEHAPGESSEAIRGRVAQARRHQTDRLQDFGLRCNADLDQKALRRSCPLSKEARDLMKRAMESYQFSARAHDRVLRVARTIADLQASEAISPQHLGEAIHFRLPSEASIS